LIIWTTEVSDGIPQAIKALKDKPYVFSKMFVPHDARATDQSTGKTRIDTAKSLWPNVEWEIVPSLSVDDGIQQGKLFFSRLWIDEKNCQLWLDYIAQYRQEWDEAKGMFKEKARHDFTSHAGDVHRYAAIVAYQMTNEEPKAYKQSEAEPASIYMG
jgi:hypothetical protein